MSIGGIKYLRADAMPKNLNLNEVKRLLIWSNFMLLIDTRDPNVILIRKVIYSIRSYNMSKNWLAV